MAGFVVLWVAVLATALLPSHGIILNTKYGGLEGSLRNSRNGREFHSFIGIPYARPPLGELRFKSPVPAKEWENVRNAKGDSSPMCTQIMFYIPKLRNITMGEEDCLYLNVFTPQVKAKMPVLVYIHGGGWRCGHPGPVSRAEFLMNEDVVLVTLTYRLGALGFLSTEDEVITGNFGLKDQSTALKWIKENIDVFGGDPDSITIFGESAGGASVHYHMMSPLSKGLFHKGISESGTSSSFWAWSALGEERGHAHKVAEHLHCPAQPHEEMLKCLLTKSNTEIIEAEHIFNFADFDPAVVFQPVVEDKSIEGAFITTHPLQSKTYVPWILGVTSSEGSFKIASVLQGGPKEKEWIEKNFEKFLPEILLYKNKVRNYDEITRRIMKHYVKEPVITMENLSDVFSDAFLIWPSMVSIRNHFGPAYYYYFDHRGEASLSDLFGDKEVIGDLGVTHADELLYLFNYKDVIPDIKGKDVDKKISEKLIKLWVNFAKSGSPSDNWKEYADEGEYLHMKTDEFVMDENLKSDMISFWDGLPLYKKETGQKDEL